MSVPTWATVVLTLGVAAVPQVAAPLAGAFLPDADERCALDLQLLQASLGVGSNEAHEGNAAIRGWAVDMINSVAEVQIQGDAEKSLVLGTTGLVNFVPMAS